MSRIVFGPPGPGAYDAPPAAGFDANRSAAVMRWILSRSARAASSSVKPCLAKIASSAWFAFGPIAVRAVRAVVPWSRGDDGFELPAEVLALEEL